MEKESKKKTNDLTVSDIETRILPAGGEISDQLSIKSG